jgi:hypothetical protein
VYLLHFVLFTGVGTHILFRCSEGLIFVYTCDQRVAKDVESTANLSMQEMGQNEGTAGKIETVHGSELPKGNAPATVSISFHCIIQDISFKCLKNLRNVVRYSMDV